MLAHLSLSWPFIIVFLPSHCITHIPRAGFLRTHLNAFFFVHRISVFYRQWRQTTRLRTHKSHNIYHIQLVKPREYTHYHLPSTYWHLIIASTYMRTLIIHSSPSAQVPYTLRGQSLKQYTTGAWLLENLSELGTRTMMIRATKNEPTYRDGLTIRHTYIRTYIHTSRHTHT